MARRGIVDAGVVRMERGAPDASPGRGPRGLAGLCLGWQRKFSAEYFVKYSAQIFYEIFCEIFSAAVGAKYFVKYFMVLFAVWQIQDHGSRFLIELLL